MFARDTIAAIATPPGSGGIHVIRLSGPDARTIAQRLCPGLPPDPESHRLYLGPILDAEGRALDRGLGVLMTAPRSYTGEDVAEIHCHGGSLLARSIVAAALECGARAARRGEFTLRAFLNGKVDLAQAESVADLVAARTPAALRIAETQLAGELSREVEDLRQRLIGVTAELEVAIDFSEEEVGELDRDRLLVATADVRRRIESLAATGAQGRLLREGARVAIVGRPNVGKSSLLNRLLRSDRAIVTAIPGTTRDVIEESIDLSGIPVTLVDTAGMRKGADEVEKIGIGRTVEAIAGADLVILVLDSSQELQEADRQAFDATQHARRIILINKVDLPIRLDEKEVLSRCPTPPVRASMKTGEDLDRLVAAVTENLGSGMTEPGIVVTRERHIVALRAAGASLEASAESLRAGHPPDIVAVDVLAALDHLGEIVGRTSPEDVLDRIFSEFCIGK